MFSLKNSLIHFYLNGELYKEIYFNDELYKEIYLNGELYKEIYLNGELYKEIYFNGELYKEIYVYFEGSFLRTNSVIPVFFVLIVPYSGYLALIRCDASNIGLSLSSNVPKPPDLP